MTHDPIVNEVRAVRERLAAKFDFDIHRIVADAQARQRLSSQRVVSLDQSNAAPGAPRPLTEIMDEIGARADALGLTDTELESIRNEL